VIVGIALTLPYFPFSFSFIQVLRIQKIMSVRNIMSVRYYSFSWEIYHHPHLAIKIKEEKSKFNSQNTKNDNLNRGFL
jgi:hypothetical protein